MVERTTRDVATVPALEPSMAALAVWFGEAAKVLLRGRPQRGSKRRRARAAIGHALAFATWRSLVQEQGLSNAEAVELMAGLVEFA
jgi:hypothetical protein